jgi:hypothetical protein
MDSSDAPFEEESMEVPSTSDGSRRGRWAVGGVAAAVLISAVGLAVLARVGDDGTAPLGTADTLAESSTTNSTTSVNEPVSSVPNSPATTAPAVPVASAVPADAGSWSRTCTDKLATSVSSVPERDLGGQPFGPLAPEPGLRILYPMPPTSAVSIDPVSSISRVPGGTLVRLLSVGPVHTDRIVAVVDDDGVVRWRRCIPDMYGSAAVIDAEAGVAYLDMQPPGPFGPVHWWAFDLTTGKSTVETADHSDALAAAQAEQSGNTEVTFRSSDQNDTRLRRVGADGREVWRRDDLFDPGDEGFRTFVANPASADDVVLVRACVGGPAGSGRPSADGSPCTKALLGVSFGDGSTRWELDGEYFVSLVADGYAIVNGPESMPRSELIDVRTGDVVPGGVSDAPGAFLSECCGGYDYNRVERAGAVAWSIATDWLDVWFPAGRPGPGVTVDLLGPASLPTVVARRWYPTDSPEGCATAQCSLVRATGSGFTPGETVATRCWAQIGGNWVTVGDEHQIPVAPDGSVALDEQCYFPYTADDPGGAKVMIGGVESNVVTSR